MSVLSNEQYVLAVSLGFGRVFSGSLLFCFFFQFVVDACCLCLCVAICLRRSSRTLTHARRFLYRWKYSPIRRTLAALDSDVCLESVIFFQAYFQYQECARLVSKYFPQKRYFKGYVLRYQQSNIKTQFNLFPRQHVTVIKYC